MLSFTEYYLHILSLERKFLTKYIGKCHSYTLEQTCLKNKLKWAGSFAERALEI